MGWLVGLVIAFLIISFLRNAPVIGPFVFKPLFDMAWFFIAFVVLVGAAWIAYEMTPEDRIPAEVHEFMEGVYAAVEGEINDTPPGHLEEGEADAL